MMMLLPSCGSSGFFNRNRDTLNDSSLYDPPQVHLIEGREYQFEEGKLNGRGQVFHSDYSYRDMLTGK